MKAVIARKWVGFVSLLVGCLALIVAMYPVLDQSTGREPSPFELFDIALPLWLFLVFVSHVAMVINETRIKWNLLALLVYFAMLVFSSGKAPTTEIGPRSFLLLIPLIGWPIVNLLDIVVFELYLGVGRKR